MILLRFYYEKDCSEKHNSLTLILHLSREQQTGFSYRRALEAADDEAGSLCKRENKSYVGGQYALLIVFLLYDREGELGKMLSSFFPSILIKHIHLVRVYLFIIIIIIIFIFIFIFPPTLNNNLQKERVMRIEHHSTWNNTRIKARN